LPPTSLRKLRPSIENSLNFLPCHIQTYLSIPTLSSYLSESAVLPLSEANPFTCFRSFSRSLLQDPAPSISLSPLYLPAPFSWCSTSYKHEQFSLILKKLTLISTSFSSYCSLSLFYS
jgi:hypothetical protein